MTCTIVSSGTELQIPCKNENEQPYLNIKEELHQIISLLYAKGYDTFYLNCEYGIPLWSAEIICMMKAIYPVKLCIAIPYEEQATDWTEEQRNRYYHIHEQADSVSIINTHYHPECYHDANVYMLNNSNLLYVFGNTEQQLDAVKTANALSIEIIYI